MTRETLANCYLRHTGQPEQYIYNYLLYNVQTKHPDEILEEFRRVLLEGAIPNDLKLYDAIAAIVNSQNVEYEYKFILNRCCHILINRWQMHPQLQGAIPELIEQFKFTAPPTMSSSRTARRIRQLSRDFIKTEQFLTLQRLARVIKIRKESQASNLIQVGDLINRYPYLYEHCLLSEDSSYEHQQTVRKIQAQMQHTFELDLSHYVTYQVRLAQLARQYRSLEKARLIIPKIQNPTLLSERELGLALKQFVGRVHNGYSYKDLSRHFLSSSIQAPSYQVFKDELYEYLTTSIDSRYGNRQFNEKLYKKLQEILPQCDTQKPSEFLLLRTSSQLLNYLVVESRQRPEHYVFVDLITNLGPTSTIGLLLKVVLLCNKVKPHLEKRFSILFTHYEASSREGVPWLVKSLENLHIAWSLYFGAADVSYLTQIM